MKKIILAGVLFFSIGSKLCAQALESGDNSLNLYYGVNVLKTVYKNLASETGEDIQVKGTGPFGLVYEHMMTDKIGLGAEIGYGTTEVSWIDPYADPFTGLITNYSYKYSIKMIRAQLRMNLHFAKSENFDAYMLFSAGYRGTNFSFETNDPAYIEDEINSFFPFGVKVGLGLRYFFTDNIGLHTEIAIGSPLFCGGISFKF